ncbi:MAG: TIM44-like domain-containing protein [Chitinophagales bacterium]
MQSRYLKRITTLVLLLISVGVFAAAGGGGGGSSSGGGSSGDGGGEIIFWIIRIIFEIIWRLPFPFNIIVLVIIAIAIYYFYKKSQQSSGLNTIPSYNSKDGSVIYGSRQDKISNEFLAKNSDFDKEKFKQKVRTAFTEIQNAWMFQDLSKVRKWISDGVYQRFNTQFIMMKQIEQTNKISNINIHEVFIDDIESDGVYDIMHVGIQYSMYDAFESKKFTKLNDGGPLQALDFWSFIKKSGVKEKDLYHTTNCPNCGGNLPDDGGETAKCPYCSTITYLGDYDWILAEITQPDDYYNSNSKFEKQGKFSKKIREQIGEKQDFSLQLLEDKASNGYMQMMTALVMKKPEITRRFVSDNLYEKVEKQIKSQPKFVFNRLYLNHVTSFDYYRENGKDNIVVALKCSSQKILRIDTNSPEFNYQITARNEVLIMSRDVNAAQPQGSLYAHSCPNCGAPIKDTIEVNCTYCNAQLNSTKYEWIISDWMSANEYETFKKSTSPALVVNKNVDDLDELYEVRDYAFNNVLVMMAADGVFAQEELDYANTLAKKWNYNADKLHGLMTMAKNKQLVIRLPENPKKKDKIIAQMEKVANLDGTISVEELKILNDLKGEKW